MIKHFFKKRINKKQTLFKRGFTLVETLVATSIFTVSILLLMTILSNGIADTTYAKKKITAAYLAQEGIEYVRNIRDTYVLYSSSGQVGWDAFIDHMTNSLAGARCDQSNGCYLDDRNLDYTVQTQPINSVSVVACGSSCETLLYDSSTGKYGYVTGTNSGYIRQIKISQISINEIKVFSIVYWNQGSGAYNLTFSESLFNWVE